MHDQHVDLMTGIKSKKQTSRISGIDSLRFLAFLMVFLFHTSSKFYFGFLGVDFFFVLSSFLLTFLALKEIDRTGEFSKKNFFMRRVLRIFPLYYLILISTLVITPLVFNQLGKTVTLPEHQWLFWFFLSNYDHSKFILPLRFLWSIGVEEQFYLLFILLSPFFKKSLKWVITGLLLMYFIYDYIDGYFEWNNYQNVFFHFANFAVGMLGGYMFFLKKKNFKWWVVIFTLSTFAVFFIPPTNPFFNIALSLSFVSLIFIAWRLSSFTKSNGLFKVTEYLGKYTYGLYVYSGFVIIFFNLANFFESKILTIFSELTLTFFIAYCSYHFFEKRFLRLKKKFGNSFRSKYTETAQQL